MVQSKLLCMNLLDSKSSIRAISINDKDNNIYETKKKKKIHLLFSQILRAQERTLMMSSVFT